MSLVNGSSKCLVSSKKSGSSFSCITAAIYKYCDSTYFAHGLYPTDALSIDLAGTILSWFTFIFAFVSSRNSTQLSRHAAKDSISLCSAFHSLEDTIIIISLWHILTSAAARDFKVVDETVLSFISFSFQKLLRQILDGCYFLCTTCFVINNLMLVVNVQQSITKLLKRVEKKNKIGGMLIHCNTGTLRKQKLPDNYA